MRSLPHPTVVSRKADPKLHLGAREVQDDLDDLNRRMNERETRSGSAITLKNTGTITVTSGADTYLNFDTIEYDTSGGALWDISTPTHLRAPNTGIYLLTANWAWGGATFADGTAYTATLERHGSAHDFHGDWDFSSYVGAARGNTGFATHVHLIAADYVEIDAIAYGTGASLNRLRAGWAQVA